jgi:hypothetical protein
MNESLSAAWLEKQPKGLALALLNALRRKGSE